MKPIQDDDILTISFGGLFGLQNLLKGVIAAYDKGYVLDPQDRERFMAKSLSPFEYQAVMIKSSATIADELSGKTKDELIEIIDKDFAKERLLDIAKYLEVEIPNSIKVPRAIAKHLRDAVINKVEATK